MACTTSRQEMPSHLPRTAFDWPTEFPGFWVWKVPPTSWTVAAAASAVAVVAAVAEVPVHVADLPQLSLSSLVAGSHARTGNTSRLLYR